MVQVAVQTAVRAWLHGSQPRQPTVTGVVDAVAAPKPGRDASGPPGRRRETAPVPQVLGDRALHSCCTRRGRGEKGMATRRMNSPAVATLSTRAACHWTSWADGEQN